VSKKLFKAFLVVMVLFSFTTVFAGEKDKIECPVCGYLVNPKDALSYEHEGITYYFCEAGCKAYFLQNKEEMTSGKTYDAVCGMVIERDKAVSGEHKDRMVHFCSEDCKAKYFGDPGQYEINYDMVSGEVMPVRQMKHSTEFEGRTYYFGSEESLKEFEKNPDAYVYEACPIGGDVFLRKDAGGKREYKGKVYYFGCKGCLDKFDEGAEKYMSQKGRMKCQKPCTEGEKPEGCPLKKAAKKSS
jgi:YHS domain-containing protein